MTKKKKKPPPPKGDVFGGEAGKVGTAMTIVHGPGEAPPGDPKDRAYLRYAAGVYYTTDLHGCSLTDMTKHPIYGVIPYGTLEYWSKQDEWVKRREANREQWRKKIEAAVGNKLAQARVKQLESLERVYQKVLEKLESDAVAAGTYEGLTNALLRIAEVMDEWRSKLAMEIWPSMAEASAEGSQGQALMLRAKLSREEARAAATLIIQKRREQLKAEQEAKSEGEG